MSINSAVPNISILMIQKAHLEIEVKKLRTQKGSCVKTKDRNALEVKIKSRLTRIRILEMQILGGSIGL